MFNASTLLFPFQDPLKQLKDLTQLRKQLEEIQRRVENEVSVGIPQVCCCNTSMSNFSRAQYMYFEFNCQFKCWIYLSVELMENKSGVYMYPTSKCYWLMQCCGMLCIALICYKCVLISCRKVRCSDLHFWGAFWQVMWWPSCAPQQSWACCWEP